ncbi:hypothetical protein [Spelaeicoccus albus]|uniref:Uncharacterized protein n=1 Tax=Spelaeicoccus albus TaxID=1280376 RepID=A0A7Z0ACQ4_9MICO|nr:hypothetical protein [Spelaeicoccus albus]NYI66876.1 hypothetical protein [Spelaeicoccus albus]
MANILMDDDTVTVSLSALEKVEALHGDVSVARSAIVGIHEVPDGLAEVHGVRLPGTGLPGMILVGTFREPDRRTFAVCHGANPAVVFDLKGEHFDRLVVTVDNPEALVGLE